MRALIVLSLLVFVTDMALAVPVAINRRDVKFPTQQMVEKQSYFDVLASSSIRLKSGTAGPTSAAALTLSTFDNQPDFARNIEISPGGTTGDIEYCEVAINGTDLSGAVLQEKLVFQANATQKVVGNKAFKTVTSVAWPINCESGGFAATWSIGIGEKLGVKACMGNAGDVLFSLLNGSKEATGPTIAVHATIMASNTTDFVGTMNNANDLVLYFFQNFGCF